MSEPSREQLIRRRDEINEQLDRVNREERIELDIDPEEQAIQVEQDEVAVTMEANLRRELAVIEDALLGESS
jgi:RNA polymerase-binding transcription factor DksA